MSLPQARIYQGGARRKRNGRVGREPERPSKRVMAEPQHIEDEKRTLILTGASRGIGHATVKRFSSAGWRVITCSRHAFPENCPWAAGPEDHIQVDLSNPEDTTRAVRDMRERLQDGKLHALVNNAGISPKNSPPPRGEVGGPGFNPGAPGGGTRL